MAVRERVIITYQRDDGENSMSIPLAVCMHTDRSTAEWQASLGDACKGFDGIEYKNYLNRSAQAVLREIHDVKFDD